jgi:peptidoglycan/xylan/chitin deacetylase (PgdA/CDA1 family)
MRGVILLYHRVAEPSLDPFELAVSERQFREHLDVLETLGRVLPLEELVFGAAGGDGTHFAVTFDDGYHDNLAAAAPVLAQHGVPATVFVATAFVGGEPFWWDELAQLVLGAEPAVESVELDIGTTRRSWSLAADDREASFHEIWSHLQQLGDADRRRALELLRDVFHVAAHPDGRSLTVDELDELAAVKPISVGAHTCTHPVLRGLTTDEARDEIHRSKRWLEERLGRPVRAFSYPFGGRQHYGAAAVELVREAGFELACSAEPGTVPWNPDAFQLPRVIVGAWDGDVLEATLSTLLANGAGR